MRFLLLLIIAAPLACFAQSDTAIKYTAVVAVDSARKDQLYQRALTWLNDAFKSSKDVIQIQDKENGYIAGKGIIISRVEMRYLGSRVYDAKYNFSLKIIVKDGKYKYEATDFDNYQIGSATNTGGLGLLTSSNTCPKKYSMVRQSKMDEIWLSAKSNLASDIDALIASLKSSMNKPAIIDF